MVKGKFKWYFSGVVGGIVLTIATNHYVGRFLKNEAVEKPTKQIVTEVDFKDEFSEPKFEESFRDTKEVAECVLTDFLGQKYVFRADTIRTYSFTEEGLTVTEAPKIKVPVENNDYLLKEYISELEAKVYNVLNHKDKIKNQFYIFRLFEWMEELYKEYLDRKPFDTLENRKEAIYKVGYDYIVSDKDYTIGGYKFSELNKAIQKDILKIFQNINYMRLNGKVKAQSEVDKFLDYQGKVLKYELFRIGR